jgi:hypothetical protein
MDGGLARRKAAAYTNRINADIHASCEIRTHDPTVRASEDSSEDIVLLHKRFFCMSSYTCCPTFFHYLLYTCFSSVQIGLTLYESFSLVEHYH